MISGIDCAKPKEVPEAADIVFAGPGLKVNGNTERNNGIINSPFIIRAQT